MKKIIILLLLLITSISQAQPKKSFELYDSLNTSRRAITADLNGFLYVDVIFRGLTTNDTIRIYNLLDSVEGSGYSKFTRDTIPSYLRDLNLYTESDSGFIRATASPFNVAVLNPNINKLLIRWIDSNFDSHTVYLRIRGRNY